MESILRSLGISPLDLGISTAITILREKIPNNPGEKNKYRKVFLKVFKEIAKQYSDDPDFKLNQ